MKKKVIILGSLITIGVISAFGFINRPTSNTSCAEPEKDSNTIELSAIGINGGLFVDDRNGSVSQFVADAPELFYTVQGRSFRKNSELQFTQSITQEKLNKAKLVDDLIENYPATWIKEYVMVDVTANIDGNIVKKQGVNNVLTKAQKNLLSSVKIASDIVIAIHYNKSNSSEVIETRQMNVSMIVVPEIEAEYNGSYKQMIAYLKDNSMNEINRKNFKEMPQTSISFVVNENGETENVDLVKSTMDAESNQLLIELIEKMPKWKPAKNAKGLTVKQEFIFNVGIGGC